MSKLKVMGSIGVASFVGLCALAGGAQASTTISFTGYGVALPGGETLVTDFSNPASLPSGYSLSGDGTFMTGSDSSGAAPAFSDSTRDAGQYLSVQGGEYEILSTPALNEISMYVGSLDAYNTVTFTFADGGTQSFTGSQLAAYVPAPGSADGDQQGISTNGRFTFTFDNAVDSVRFDSSQNSFEIASIAAPGGVPEPATWAVMLLGLFGLGSAVRTRRKVIAAAA